MYGWDISSCEVVAVGIYCWSTIGGVVVVCYG